MSNGWVLGMSIALYEVAFILCYLDASGRVIAGRRLVHATLAIGVMLVGFIFWVKVQDKSNYRQIPPFLLLQFPLMSLAPRVRRTQKARTLGKSHARDRQWAGRLLTSEPPLPPVADPFRPPPNAAS